MYVQYAKSRVFSSPMHASILEGHGWTHGIQKSRDTKPSSKHLSNRIGLLLRTQQSANLTSQDTSDQLFELRLHKEL